MNDNVAPIPEPFTYPIVFSDPLGHAQLTVQSDVTAWEAFDLSVMLMMVTQNQNFAWRLWARDRNLLRHLKPTLPPTRLVLPR